MSDTSHNDHDYQNASQFDPYGGSESCYETMVDLTTHGKEEVYKFVTYVWRLDKGFVLPKKDRREHLIMNFFNNILGHTLSQAYYLPKKLAKGVCILSIHIHTSWTSATRKFKEHESHSEVHKMAVVMGGEFQKSMDTKSLPVTQQLNQVVAEENQNTIYLKNVKYCMWEAKHITKNNLGKIFRNYWNLELNQVTRCWRSSEDCFKKATYMLWRIHL